MNGRTDRAVLPQTHQDEFPAEYSLAGCSPAEPASASSATLILNQKPPVRLQNSSERQPSPKARVSKHRAGQEAAPACDPPLTFKPVWHSLQAVVVRMELHVRDPEPERTKGSAQVLRV